MYGIGLAGDSQPCIDLAAPQATPRIFTTFPNYTFLLCTGLGLMSNHTVHLEKVYWFVYQLRPSVDGHNLQCEQ